jgi:2,3-bisphosphoglycerate-dependent phosphoglycerate mutase
VARVVPFWDQELAPAIRAGRKVLIAAHGNSLRALLKHIEQIDEAAIVDLNIPTAQPMLIEFNDKLVFQSRRYLGDAGEIARAIASVAAQGKTDH